MDIANGAPSGEDATDQIVLTWVDGRDGLNHEHVMFTTSTDGAATWTDPIMVEQAGDRGYYSAPAISPNGSDVWLVYNAFLEPFKESAVGPENDRPLVGVLLHADVSGSSVGAFSEVHRGQAGDARGSSQNNLAAEFLGDYVYAAATRTYGAAVWNDVRSAADCPAIDEYRQALHDQAVSSGQQTAEAEEPRGESEREKPNQGEDQPAVAPDVQKVCPAGFGNSDGQVTGSPNRFTSISGASHLLLLTQGYAILDNPTMPIVGPGETANDTYVEQLVASAQAAVDKVVAMGVADRDRMGIGGHSYGAFMTANLLAHCDLFRAGIARSGAYNRTLTPFGFQNEQRTFWEVPQVYARLSPFWYADKVNVPVLLLHGEADNNTGTFPIQSDRF